MSKNIDIRDPKDLENLSSAEIKNLIFECRQGCVFAQKICDLALK